VKKLVWFEVHSEIVEAITREKQIKKWNRSWKVNLIQESNPDWRDLYDEIVAWEVGLDSRQGGRLGRE
jgi:putative endonuclease